MATASAIPDLDRLRPAGTKRSGQARPDRQRVPPPGGPPERRRSRRGDQARGPADQPRHRLPHAAVDGGGGHRPQGRFRRGTVPVRALVPASSPLSPHLQDLQPVVRVPELGHRGAGRGSGGGARVHRAPERGANLRHLRGVPHRTCAGGGGLDLRAAVRPRRAAHRDRHRAQRPGVLRPGRAHDQGRRAASRSSTSSPRRRSTTSARSRTATASCWSRIRSSSRGRRSCSSRARPTACSPTAPSSCAATASTISRRCASASAASAARTASSSATASGSRTPKASRSSSSSPKRSASTSSC